MSLEMEELCYSSEEEETPEEREEANVRVQLALEERAVEYHRNALRAAEDRRAALTDRLNELCPPYVPTSPSYDPTSPWVSYTPA